MNKIDPKPLLTVIATITAKPGREKLVRRALLALIPPTRLEQGVVDYELHVNKSGSKEFLFYENWYSKPHLDKHLRQPHLKAFDRATKGFLACPVQITLWKRIG